MYSLSTSRQMDSAQLLHVYRLLEQVYGLTYDSPDSGLVAQAIADRMEATGAEDVGSYARLLEGEGMPAELRELVDIATVRETRFFREGDLFAVLADEIVPAILDLYLHSGRVGGPLMAWSAGCSTGDEAYSIAIMLLEMVRKGLPLLFRVIGTDVSPSALAQAASGVYPEGVVSRIDRELLERYFRRVWLSANQELAHEHEVRAPRYQVVSELAACVGFLEHNLTDFPYPQQLDGFDLILCRNVLMYFTEETASRVVKELSSRLNEGGYLILDPWMSCSRLTELGLQQVECPYGLILRKAPQREFRLWIDDERSESEPHSAGCCSSRSHPAECRAPEHCPPESRSPEPGSLEDHAVTRCSAEPPAQADVETAISQARMCAGSGDWARAQSLLAAAEEVAPLDPRVYRLMGEVHLQRSDLEAASRCFARLIYLQPRSAVAYWRMADIYRRMCRYRDEMRQLHNVLQCIEDSEADAECEVSGHTLMRACLNRIGELRRRLREVRRASARS